jgi:hypothetical protein
MSDLLQIRHAQAQEALNRFLAKTKEETEEEKLQSQEKIDFIIQFEHDHPKLTSCFWKKMTPDVMLPIDLPNIVDVELSNAFSAYLDVNGYTRYVYADVQDYRLDWTGWFSGRLGESVKLKREHPIMYVHVKSEKDRTAILQSIEDISGVEACRTTHTYMWDADGNLS